MKGLDWFLLRWLAEMALGCCSCSCFASSKISIFFHWPCWVGCFSPSLPMFSKHVHVCWLSQALCVVVGCVCLIKQSLFYQRGCNSLLVHDLPEDQCFCVCCPTQPSPSNATLKISSSRSSVNQLARGNKSLSLASTWRGFRGSTVSANRCSSCVKKVKQSFLNPGPFQTNQPNQEKAGGVCFSAESAG